MLDGVGEDAAPPPLPHPASSTAAEEAIMDNVRACMAPTYEPGVMSIWASSCSPLPAVALMMNRVLPFAKVASATK